MLAHTDLFTLKCLLNFVRIRLLLLLLSEEREPPCILDFLLDLGDAPQINDNQTRFVRFAQSSRDVVTLWNGESGRECRSDDFPPVLVRRVERVRLHAYSEKLKKGYALRQ